jgi:hypothetical protein
MRIEEVIFLLGLIVLAYWKRDQFFVFVAGSASILFGLAHFQLWYYGLPLIGIGLYMYYSAVIAQWR